MERGQHTPLSPLLARTTIYRAAVKLAWKPEDDKEAANRAASNYVSLFSHFAMLTDLLCPSASQRVPLNRDVLPCMLKVLVRHFSCKLFTRQSLATVFLGNLHDHRPTRGGSTTLSVTGSCPNVAVI
jgi:hypothetical protein